MFNGNLSVFFPAYNEEKNIERTVTKAIDVLKKLDLKNWEVIVINDGSEDKTLEVAEKLAQENNRVRVINKENGGYGTALRAGFSNAKYDWVAFTDSDGQFDFSEIGKFLEETDAADYIIGYRIRRNDSLFRLISAKIWALSVFLLFRVWVKDIDCGFRMIDMKALEAIPALESTRGAMINAELLIKVKRKGFRIVQVGVHHYPRRAGKATGVNLNVIIKSYADLIKLFSKR